MAPITIPNQQETELELPVPLDSEFLVEVVVVVAPR